MEQLKKTVTTAYCDKCGKYVEWNIDRLKNIVSVSFAKYILRKDNGWCFGKKHLCDKCVNKIKI
jgi:hypothetical protein